MKFEQLEGDEHVLSTEESGIAITNSSPAKVYIIGSLVKTLADILVRHYIGSQQSAWITEGVDCRLLKVGAPRWVKGKVRLKIVFEFCPDEPAVLSELEEFRQ